MTGKVRSGKMADTGTSATVVPFSGFDIEQSDPISSFAVSGNGNSSDGLTNYRARVDNNVRRITDSVVENAWETCLQGMSNVRITVYVVLFVTVLLFVGILFNWSNALILLLVITQVVCLSYSALQLTNDTARACNYAGKNL